MTFVAVEYVYDPALAEQMAQVRPAHREFLGSLFQQGKLVASGPFTDGEVPGALILLEAKDSAQALELLEADPFFQAQLIASRSARTWNPVIGEFAGR